MRNHLDSTRRDAAILERCDDPREVAAQTERVAGLLSEWRAENGPTPSSLSSEIESRIANWLE